MKKIFSLLFALVMTANLWADAIEVDGIWYTFNETAQTATVTYNGTSYSSNPSRYTGTITIPSSVTFFGDTYTVTEIGASAFRGTGVQYVNLPATLTTISDYAFYDCTSLLTITVPDKVTKIGDYVFYDCTMLQTVTLSTGLTYLGSYAFSGCSQITAITIPENVKTIGNYAFRSTGITSVVWNARSANATGSSSGGPFKGREGYITSFVFGDSVQTIPSYVCSNMTALSSVTIGKNVTSINSKAFYQTYSITTINWNAKRTTSFNGTFSDSNSRVTSVNIGNEVELIPDNFCYDFSQLASITIPGSVTEIGQYAFYNCTALKSVQFNEGLTSIQQHAFYGCSALEALSLPNSLQQVGESAFSGCSKLKSIVIPKNVTSLEAGAFLNLPNVQKVVMQPLQAVTRPSSAVFYSSQSNVPLYVGSADLVQAYRNAGWSNEFKHITSDFPYSIQVSSEDETKGTVEIVQQANWANTNMIIRANPATNYRFKAWSDNNTANPRTINMLTSGADFPNGLVARFARQYSIQVTASGNGTVQLYVDDTKQGAGASVSGTFDEGASVRIVANPQSGYFFRKWNDGNTSKERTFTLSSNKTYTAEFVKNHTVKVYSDSHGYVTGGGSYPDGEVTITAEARDDGYAFDQWNDGDQTNPRVIYVVSDTTFTASFKEGWDGTSTSIPQGQGTASNPYKITKAKELLWFKFQVDAGKVYANTYAVIDVDTLKLFGQTWEPIGSSSQPFRGHFNGQQHYIVDYQVKMSSTTSRDNRGLFGYADGATIQNIKVKNAQVKGYQNVGVICGYAANTNIIGCDNEAVVEGSLFVGGICGKLENSATITNCNNEGEVRGTGNYVGGVAGYLYDATVETCVNNKSVSSTGNYVGGVAGAISGSNSTVTGCSATETATVVGGKYTGGLIGKVSGGAHVTGNTTRGAVTGTDQEVGGVIGTLDGSYVENVFNYGKVTSNNSYVGGLIGNSINTSYVTSCANAGTVVELNNQNIGGLIGYAGATTIKSCINIGVIKGHNYTGGLIGYQFDNAKMENSANFGAVSGADRVGGLAGEARATLESCFSAARVTGTSSYVGAVAGFVQSDQQVINLTYDNQLCLLTVAIGNGRGEDNVYGVPTAELTGTSVEGFSAVDWTMGADIYPTPVTLSSNNIRHAAASAVLFASNDNADNFAHDATLSKANRSTWTSKGGTQINGTTAKPAIIGADTLYATNGKAVKAVPVRVTSSTVQSYTLTVTAGSHGSVSTTGGTYAQGTTVEVEAIPDNGYHFLKWSDNVTDNPRTFVMNQNISVTALFEKNPTPKYQVTITAGPNGSVDNQGGLIDEGESITVRATPNTGYRFAEWSDHNTQNPRTIVVTGPIELKALFELIPPTTYTLTITSTAGGHVDNQGGEYVEGTTVTVNAVPDNDYLFVQWSDGVTDNPRTFVMNRDITVEAQFTPIKYYHITVSVDGTGGTVNDTVNNKTYRTGSKVLIEAKPSDDDHRFVTWSDGVKTNPREVIIMSDTVIKARFEAIPYYTLNVTAGTGGTVDESVNKSYREGTQVTIKATPNEGYKFVEWNDNHSTDNPRTVTMTKDITTKAIFSEILYFEVWVGNAVGGSVEGAGIRTIEEDASVTIKANPYTNYTFLRWSDGSTANPYTFTVKKGITLYPIFITKDCKK